MNEKLQRQIAHAYANSPATRDRFDAAGVAPDAIATVADLAQLPILPKDDVVRMQQTDPPFGGLLAVPLASLSHIFFSPGPLYEPDIEDDTGALDVAADALRQSGFGDGDVVINTLSYHLVPAGLLLDKALVNIGCTVVPGGVGNSDLQLRMMRDLGVTGYVGTPSFLMQLIQKAEESGADFAEDFSLVKGFFTAEPFPPSLRARLVGYGISCGNAYATAELGFMALDTEGSMAMRLLEGPIIEIVDPDTGQVVEPGAVGEVVVTNFSQAYPLIRFGTGDMAVNIDPAPGESRQSDRALTLVGRRGEAVKVRGMFVHPNQLRFAAGRVIQFDAIQGIVTRDGARDHFTIRVVSPDEAKADMLQAAIRQVCRVSVDEVKFVASIDGDAPGMVDARVWD